MTEQVWADLYTGSERERVPAGTYRVKVETVREAPASSTLFLDLRVLDGPEAPKLVQVNLYVPKPGEPASFYFGQRIAGFRASPQVVEAYKAAASANDKERMIRVIGDNVVDQFVVATIGVQTAESGGEQYAGNNELTATRPDTGQVVMFPGKAETETPPKPPAEPPPTPEPEPAPEPPAPEPEPSEPGGNGAGEKEDVEALRARLAAAEAAAKNDAVANASAEVGGEEPF